MSDLRDILLPQDPAPPVRGARLVLADRKPAMRCRLCRVEKHPEEFYKSDRRTCRECIKATARANRLANLQHARAYDRERASRPDRIAARTAYQQTEAFRASHNRATRRYAVSQSKRRAAQVAAGNAIRDGRLVPWPACAMPDCDCTTVEAHHPDYDDPLSVVWLCNGHHRAAHRNG